MEARTNVDSTSGRAGVSRFRGALPVVAPVFAIVLLALALRMYRADEEPITLDDANGTICMDCPSLGAYLACYHDPEGSIKRAHTPLYYIGQYGWTRVFGRTPMVLRSLTILISLCSIPLIYLLGSMLLSRSTGLVAALLFALSPQQIHLSQSIRPYPLYLLCAAVALVALVQANRSRRPLGWWVLNGAANLALFWTHFYGVLFVPVEGCLLVVLRTPLKTLAYWAMSRAVLLLPSLVWFLNRGDLYASGSMVFGLLEAPGPLEVLRDMLGGDALSMVTFSVSYDLWPFWSDSLSRILLRGQVAWDLALCTAYLGAIVYCVYLLVWTGPGKGADTETAGNAVQGIGRVPSRSGLGFVLVLALLPPLVLFCLSHAWRPCYQARYWVYALIGLYVLAGAAWSYLPGRRSRVFGMGLILLLYAYQLNILLPSTTRTDCYKAVDWIQEEGTPARSVLVGVGDGGGNGFAVADVFRLHTPPDWEITPIHTVEEGLIRLSRLFDTTSAAVTGKENVVWVVFDLACGPVESTMLFERSLDLRGISWQREVFPVERGLVVYRTEPDQAVRHGTGESAAPESILDGLGLTFDTEADRSAALAFVSRRLFRPLPDFHEAESLTMLAEQCLEPEGAVFAAALAQKALAIDPEYPETHFVLGATLLMQGHHAKAVKALQPGIEQIDPFMSQVFTPLFDAMAESAAPADWREATAKLLRYGMPVPWYLLHITELTGWVDVGMHLSNFER